MTRTRFSIFLLSAALVWLLSGCSRIQFVYNQMDWVIPIYLESYMELSDAQSTYLKEHVKSFMAWHCSTQLTAYASLIRDAAGKIQTGHIERAQIEYYSQRIEQFWLSIVKQGSPAIAEVLSNSSDTQIEELFKDFDKGNREWLDKFREQTAEELRSDYNERMTTELERWFGPLNRIQQQAVAAWSYNFSPLGMEGLATRVQWQSRLRTLLDKRKDLPYFNAAFDELVINGNMPNSSAYQKKLDHNREVTIDLIYRVMNNTSETQRQHQENTAESIARDIDKLVCSADKPQTTH
jgi:polyhydroxyalkanoate synthesis regulator protein